ncbi:MAG: hypothetical protein AAF217_07780 [Pseudomonadota bacterium]
MSYELFGWEGHYRCQESRGKGVLAWMQWRGDKMNVAPVLTDRLNGDQYS